jgi:hypothetical protein
MLLATLWNLGCYPAHSKAGCGVEGHFEQDVLNAGGLARVFYPLRLTFAAVDG